MTADQLDELRAAFGELMGAERRLRSRDPRAPGELSTGQVRALVQLAKDEAVHRGRARQARRAQPRRDDRDARPARERGHDHAPPQRDRPPPGHRRADRPRAHEEVAAKRAAWEQIWRDGLQAHDDAELEAAARIMRTIAALLDGIGREPNPPKLPGRLSH